MCNENTLPNRIMMQSIWNFQKWEMSNHNKMNEVMYKQTKNKGHSRMYLDHHENELCWLLYVYKYLEIWSIISTTIQICMGYFASGRSYTISCTSINLLHRLLCCAHPCPLGLLICF